MNFGSKNFYVPCVYKWSCGRYYSLIGTWRSLRSPTQGKLILKNFILLGVRFYIPNLPDLVSPFPQKLGVCRTPWCLSDLALGVNWLHVGEYNEKLWTSGVWKEMQEQDVGEERRAWNSPVNSGKPKRIVNFFIFTTWHDMDLWCINSAHKIDI